MLSNLNDVVKENDILYHLGDFAFGEEDRYKYYRDRIKCRNIQFLCGNHDKVQPYMLRYLFNWVGDYIEIKHNHEKIVMSHYAMLTWNKSHRGSYMLHGHSHGSLTYPYKQRIKDVGVDTNNFKPYLLDDVLKELSLIEPYSPDHHITRE